MSSGQSLAEAVGKGHTRCPGSPLVGLGPAVTPLPGLTQGTLGRPDRCPFQELLTGWRLKASERLGRSWQPWPSPSKGAGQRMPLCHSWPERLSAQLP